MDIEDAFKMGEIVIAYGKADFCYGVMICDYEFFSCFYSYLIQVLEAGNPNISFEFSTKMILAKAGTLGNTLKRDRL
ncbi:MAG: hypothetical protein ABH886_06700 [Candidatus Desantisbacteria bacterium]